MESICQYASAKKCDQHFVFVFITPIMKCRYPHNPIIFHPVNSRYKFTELYSHRRAHRIVHSFVDIYAVNTDKECSRFFMFAYLILYPGISTVIHVLALLGTLQGSGTIFRSQLFLIFGIQHRKSQYENLRLNYYIFRKPVGICSDSTIISSAFHEKYLESSILNTLRGIPNTSSRYMSKNSHRSFSKNTCKCFYKHFLGVSSYKFLD